MRRDPATLLTIAAVVPLLAACGSDGGDATSTPAASETTITQKSPSEAPVTEGAPTTDTPPADTPTADTPTGGGPAFPEGTAGRTAENKGRWDLVLVDVRVAEHDSFDRIVLEFTGTGVPGWSVNYVDEAVLDGSGETVPLDGDAILDIYASGTTYPETPGMYYSGPRRFAPRNGGDVNDVRVVGTFEGYTQLLAGIDGARAPFRVLALTDPSRLVVDVLDEA